jgi:hypothetical protein
VATDYDAPRKTDEELAEDSLEELKAQRAEATNPQVEVDENDSVELPGADLSDESLTVRVLPKQADEFTCIKCFLVMHRSRIAKETKGKAVCSECA